MINSIINATSIHRGGGLTYLFLLHSYIDKSNKLIFLDYRAKPYINDFKKIKIIFLHRGPFRNLRILFFRLKYTFKLNIYNSKSKRKIYLTELFLNGLPPLFRIRSKNKITYVFCQNRLIFENNMNFRLLFTYNLKTQIYVLIHKFIFNLFRNSTDILIVQNRSMMRLLKDLKINNKIVLQENIWGSITKKKYSKLLKIDYKDIENNFKFRNLKNLYSANIVYFYPAYFYPHKNHSKLIKAFEALDKLKIKPYKLLLTLSNNEFKKIYKIKSSNVVLLNKLSYSEIFNTYRYVDYLIYPSLLESYGLPLLEAKLSGIDIIASDLPYVYDICKPKFVFDPNDINSISNIIKYSTLTNKRIN